MSAFSAIKLNRRNRDESAVNREVNQKIFANTENIQNEFKRNDARELKKFMNIKKAKDLHDADKLDKLAKLAKLDDVENIANLPRDIRRSEMEIAKIHHRMDREDPSFVEKRSAAAAIEKKPEREHIKQNVLGTRKKNVDGYENLAKIHEKKYHKFKKDTRTSKNDTQDIGSIFKKTKSDIQQTINYEKDLAKRTLDSVQKKDQEDLNVTQTVVDQHNAKKKNSFNLRQKEQNANSARQNGFNWIIKIKNDNY